MNTELVTLVNKYQKSIREENITNETINHLKNQIHQIIADDLYELGTPKEPEKFTDEDKHAFQALYIKMAVKISSLAFGLIEPPEEKIIEDTLTHGYEDISKTFQDFKLPSVIAAEKEAEKKKAKEKEEKRKKAAERRRIKEAEKKAKEEAEKKLKEQLESNTKTIAEDTFESSSTEVKTVL